MIYTVYFPNGDWMLIEVEEEVAAAIAYGLPLGDPDYGLVEYTLDACFDTEQAARDALPDRRARDDALGYWLCTVELHPADVPVG